MDLTEKFDTFFPIGTKEQKTNLEDELRYLQIFSNGVKTNRDIWVYNFNKNRLFREC